MLSESSSVGEFRREGVEIRRSWFDLYWTQQPTVDRRVGSSSKRKKRKFVESGKACVFSTFHSIQSPVLYVFIRHSHFSAVLRSTTTSFEYICWAWHEAMSSVDVRNNDGREREENRSTWDFRQSFTHFVHGPYATNSLSQSIQLTIVILTQIEIIKIGLLQQSSHSSRLSLSQLSLAAP